MENNWFIKWQWLTDKLCENFQMSVFSSGVNFLANNLKYLIFFFFLNTCSTQALNCSHMNMSVQSQLKMFFFFFYICIWYFIDHYLQWKLFNLILIFIDFIQNFFFDVLRPFLIKIRHCKPYLNNNFLQIWNLKNGILKQEVRDKIMLSDLIIIEWRN